ncbi:acyltransferase [Streptomyces sp. NPDC051173]|uniref:acyltransferase family protein n=1 Tax=Streptomyces sp. NPDC051173 TaxID=3155164 RepID=UPI003450D027
MTVQHTTERDGRTPPARSPAAGSRLPSLTGLRFVAAALVFLRHAIYTDVFADPGVVSVLHGLSVNTGQMGVSFFFVLSGFVLTMAARPHDTTRRFLRRRLVKIYPNHFVAFLLAAILIVPAFRWEDVVPNLLLVQTWWPRYKTLFSGNPPSWSLACEAFFYLGFPLLLRTIRKIRPVRLWPSAAGTMAAIVAVTLTVALAVPGTPAMPDGQPAGLTQFWLIYAFPPVRALDFLLGMLLARIVLSGRWIRLSPLPAASLVLVAYLAGTQLPYLYGLNALTIVPLALLIPAAATADLNGRTGLMGSRPAVWLGEISYAFYLVHGVLLIWGRRQLGADKVYSVPAGIGLLLLGLGASILAAVLLHTLVERPMMHRFSSPRRHSTPW